MATDATIDDISFRILEGELFSARLSEGVRQTATICFYQLAAVILQVDSEQLGASFDY